jgi:hypothetical protein
MDRFLCPSLMAASNSTSSKAKRQGLTIQTNRPSLRRSSTDWLWTSLLAARTIAAAAESVPYLKGVFGTVVVLLETVEVQLGSSLTKMGH